MNKEIDKQGGNAVAYVGGTPDRSAGPEGRARG